MAILTTLPELLPFTAASILLWVGVHRHVASHGPVRHARTVITANSRFYAFISLLMCAVICTTDETSFLPRYLYHLSKFYEFLDIIWVRASGGEISLHFGVHHLTTPYLTYFRVLQHSDSWWVFAALNTAHHALMYAYFGGVGGARPYLPWTGGIQLLAGIATDLVILWASPEGKWCYVFSACLLGLYFVLFVRDLQSG